MATKKTTSRRSSASSNGTWQFEALMLPYAIIAIAVILAALAMFVQYRAFVRVLPADTYQAVFLTNGQIYFGHLEGLTRSHMYLEDVYYIQESLVEVDATADAETTTDDVLDTTAETTTETSLQVVRLGANEIHEPTNELVINRDHILMWQNLQPDSQVIDAIATEKAQR